MSVNRITLRVFSLVLLLAGVLGFVTPPDAGITSGAPAYNVFHLVFGAAAFVIAWVLKHERSVVAFNLGFGLIDLYQAVASAAHLFPESHFLWKPADDVLHVVIGLALVAIGILGTRKTAVQ